MDILFPTYVALYVTDRFFSPETFAPQNHFNPTPETSISPPMPTPPEPRETPASPPIPIHHGPLGTPDFNRIIIYIRLLFFFFIEIHQVFVFLPPLPSGFTKGVGNWVLVP